MKYEDFNSLTQMQRDTLLVSMVVRNSMEDFHVEHLSDKQMKQLNPIIRQAVFDALNLIEHVRQKGGQSDPKAMRNLDFQIRCLPAYWETPERVSEGFTQYEPRDPKRTPDWAESPNIKPLYARFIRLGELKYEFGEDAVAQVEAYLSRSIAPDEPSANLRWRAARSIIDGELKTVVQELRGLKISQQKLIDARGELSRNDLREYF
ncbi:hypothetical protein ACIBCN_19980 [Nocardia sp. NPDC051052]|uniref:hypothetical protein n=1 Tax=Nocardia sp. NPDC051052 TaxID=3364322 RepID=UPI0037B3FD30